MKVYFEVPIYESPWGGGNQFIKLLKKELFKLDLLSDDPTFADIIFFNSHQNAKNVITLKRKFPNKYFIQRIDGPMKYRGHEGTKTDNLIYFLMKNIADGVIFQSHWSKKQNIIQSNYSHQNEIVITNACDEEIFYRGKSSFGDGKIKLVSSSWSSHILKGRDVIELLDNKLDFNKYSMTFIGNLSFKPNNILLLKPTNSNGLSSLLRKNHIYILPSRFEACSNSLLEALSCGLPVIARDNTSNPEVLNKRGLLFKYYDIFEKINLVEKNYKKYLNLAYPNKIQDVLKKYINFFEKTKNLIPNKKIKAQPFIYFKFKFNYFSHNTTITFNMRPIKKPWGGGNQFLLDITKYLKENGYVISYKLSKKTKCIFLVNSKSFLKKYKDRKYNRVTFGLEDLKKFKNLNPDVPIIQRINHDFSKSTNLNIFNIFKKVSQFSDYHIFISEWISEKYKNNKNWLSKKNSIIQNQANFNVFNMTGKVRWQKDKKLSIITHHFSIDMHKGFNTYKALDKLIYDNPHLKIEFTYIGNLPKDIKFKATKVYKPMFSKKLAKKLKESHVYITGSYNEVGGMHWLEAIQCGLPLLYSKKSGGNISNEAPKYGINFDDGLLDSILNIKDKYDQLYETLLNLNNTFEQTMNEKYTLLISNLINNRKIEL